MKKIVSIIIVTFSMLIMCSCGVNKPSQDTHSSTEITKANIVVVPEELNTEPSINTSVDISPNNLIKSGICGDNVKWTLTKDNVIYIYGSGDMYDYTDQPEWYSYAASSTTSYDLVVEKGVTSIGEFAFYACQIQNISLPETITRIGKGSFADNYRVTSLVIPSSVQIIADDAFERCKKLETVTLKSGLRTIGKYAFVDCENLVSISIPNTCESIDEWAFGNAGIRTITFGNGLKKIGMRAFSNCTQLESVTLPDSVTFIGKQAFSGCASLKSVTLSNSLSSIENEVFSGTGIIRISIPDSVTVIKEGAFMACESLEAVTLGNSLKAIETYAFWYCTKLQSINLSDKLIIEDNAFGGHN